MTLGEYRGQSLRARFSLGVEPVQEDQLVDIARSIGLSIIFRELGKAREFWTTDVLVVNVHLPRDERRWNIAHGLGHHELHTGNRFSFPTVTLAQMETQAELFAGALLMGETAKRMSHLTLANYHDLPQSDIHRWFCLRDGTASVLGLWNRQYVASELPGAAVGYLARSG